jgi:hypothetical protein
MVQAVTRNNHGEKYYRLNRSSQGHEPQPPVQKVRTGLKASVYGLIHGKS